MAGMNIAFEAPDCGGGQHPASGSPIDLAHLERQTMGDKALEIEVLQIFARQARLCLQELGDRGSAGAVSTAHRLKGAARGVGAFEVARLAEALEEKPDDAALFASIAAAILEAENFILKLCR